MKNSFQRLAVSFWQAARGLWMERWGFVGGGVGVWVLVLIVKWIEK